MNPERQENSQEQPQVPPQMEFNFEAAAAVHDAQCYDATMPAGRELNTQDLTPRGDGMFVNAEGDVFERALPRNAEEEQQPPNRFVLIEKANIPDDVRMEIDVLRSADHQNESWTTLYQKAKINLAYRKNPPKREPPLDPMMR